MSTVTGDLGVFGESLRSARTQRGLTLRELARRTHYSHSYLSKVENGVKRPSVELAQRCDKVLGTCGSLVQLVGLGDHAPPMLEDWLRPAQLPPGPTRFVGRTVELAELTRALAPEVGHVGAVPLVAVDGPPGVGKTALALRWAHQHSRMFPDGVLFADLGGYGGDVQSPETVLKEFLHSLGGPVAAEVSLAPVFRSVLHGKQLLIVLDNAADAQQVRLLLPGAPGCAVVVTSRHRLPGLSVRDGARRITITPLGERDSVDLLAHVAGQDRVRAEPEGAAAVARGCAGFPLALRLAGERLTDLPGTRLRAFAADLAMDEHGLNMLAVLGDPGSTARTVFSWSYLALDPGDAQVFQRLGLYPSGEISPEISAAVAVEATGLRPEAAERVLRRLAEAHLIEPVGPHLYKLYNPLRLYARERGGV
ncbi:ATP-binding protein [Actinocrispum wychmicini]|uniref:NB-ARC domain-containing protein n=1 Tax=Actinocrispum wychmicini TaxID=1213861 RepID=A0A4R2JQ53_9PSEU|nr:helix-turn-helix domain-containing protein [Actinocrispum wychmicini]TCO62341.1 NB-ARC domain-containing protein [Actinocrispum wychmicini]